MTSLRLALALFVLSFAAAIAQDLPQISKASPEAPSDAPFLMPAAPEAGAPMWLTLDCSQFDHGLCHYVPHPSFPDECCVPSPRRIGCVSFCTVSTSEATSEPGFQRFIDIAGGASAGPAEDGALAGR